MTARSFSVSVPAPEALARSLSAVRADVSAPAAGLLFASGALARETGTIASIVHKVWRGVTTVIVPSAGVVTERGEIEGAAAVSGLLWKGGRVTPVVLGEAGSPSALREALAPVFGGGVGTRASTVMLFARSDFSAETLDGLKSAAPHVCLFGAGSVGGSPVVVTAAGETMSGRAAGLAIEGFAQPLVESSPACKLLTPLHTVDEMSGGLVLKLDGREALDVLSSCLSESRSAGERHEPQPVIFAALADPADDRFVMRPVRGIDVERRGVMVAPEVRIGSRMGFAIRDAASARAGLEASARSLSQKALGAAPRFAIYLTCAGRGKSLYGAPDVEARILRQRFGDLPIAGMHSAFELAPWGPGETKLALFTAVLALFRAPS